MPAVTLALSAGPCSVDYTITGSGPDLLLVHGTAASAEIWRPFTAAVADRYTVIAPNLSGSGTTTDPGGPLTVDDLAAQVVATAEAAASGPVHLVGQSLGAVVAATVAAIRPDLVASLVLVSGWNATDVRAHALFDLWTQALAAVPELFARLLVMTGPRAHFYDLLGRNGVEELTKMFAGMLPPGTDRQIAVDHTVDITALLPAITAPTLVVGCTYDQMVPVKHQRAQAEGIGGARYAEVAAGHMLVIELAELFAATVMDFVGQHTSPSISSATGQPTRLAQAQT